MNEEAGRRTGKVLMLLGFGGLAYAAIITAHNIGYDRGYKDSSTKAAQDYRDHSDTMKKLGVCEWSKMWAEYHQCPTLKLETPHMCEWFPKAEGCEGWVKK